MKLRSVTYALFIAGLAAFSTSSLAAQSLRFGYETSQTDSQHIAAKKFNDLLQERTKGELKLKPSIWKCPARITLPGYHQ